MSGLVQLVPNRTLLTDSPKESRQLAMKVARVVIEATQPDTSRRERLRPAYAEDPALLIALEQNVALEFAVIAAANNYWKK